MDEIRPVEFKICKYLRAKNPYGGMEGGENPWLLVDNANTICWCVLSPGGAGPDGGIVEPMRCVEGRKCFVAPDIS